MDSGFMPNPEGKAGVTWNMTVETTEPLCKLTQNKALVFGSGTDKFEGFYCKQQNGIHCGKGMVFAVNAATTGDKTMSAFKQLAVNTNGTGLVQGGLQSVDPNAQAIATTVTVVAGGGGAGQAVATPPASGTLAAGGLATATVIAGAGQDGAGQACSCSCLCGMNSFPANAAIANFGGFPGLM